LSGTNLLPVNGFIHEKTAVLKTSLEAWLQMPGLDLTWTKITGAFRDSDFVKPFMAQSDLEKDAQKPQHISIPNIHVDHHRNSASEPNRVHQWTPSPCRPRKLHRPIGRHLAEAEVAVEGRAARSGRP
jgi:hypothetical protein